MIAFVSLFLGLVIGPQPVELTVGAGVATVEIVLDGRTLATLAGEPWSARCDFGRELKPQKLEAVARDAGGGEVGRAAQWLNLPHPPAVVTVALEPHEPGAPRRARLAWESMVQRVPRAVVASFDGAPLAVADPHEIVLPPHDLASLHFFRVELDFGFDVTSLVEMTFGGTYADEVTTDLTAIPIELVGERKAPPTLAELQGLFRKSDEELTVVAVDRGPAEVIVVRNGPIRIPVPRAGSMYYAVGLPKDVGLHFLSPAPKVHRGVTTSFNVFPTSAEHTHMSGGLYFLLTRVVLPGNDSVKKHRLNDVVAVAGLAAHERRRRRAVVLVLVQKDPGSPNQFTPEQALGYLEHLKVPFFVWTTDRKPEPSVWGEAVSITSLKQLKKAFKDVHDVVDRQWIVWIDGTHLPQSISLAPEARGLALP